MRQRRPPLSDWREATVDNAWAHTDGNGFNVQIETLPLDGRITLRIASEKSE
jgi:hypothetical protein